MRTKASFSFILLLCAVAQGAWAANAEVKFIQKSWNEDSKTVENTESTITDYTVLSGSHNDWLGLGVENGTGDYYYVVKSGEQVTYQTLNVFGRVHLILSDNSTLTCTGGIKAEAKNNAKLFIYSQRDGDDTNGDQEGRLTVTNSYKNAAGIGSSEAQHCGPITIHGGVINATGADYGAGIGSGACTSAIATLVADIVVYGGRVTANGGQSGAGIGGGGGYRDANFAHGGKFTIYGGTVSATGGGHAAGLGGGGGYALISANHIADGGNGGEVYVYGGKLTAQGGSGGAGIGSGHTALFSNSRHGGKLYVYGGEVFATGGSWGAGIGGGARSDGAEVHISGGSVKATGSYEGAGIGSGGECNNTSYGFLEVTGGDVLAQGGNNAAGIGGGLKSFINQVQIKGGTVIAIAGRNCHSAIGNGLFDTEQDKPLTAITLSDNLMVSVDNNANNIENVSTVVSTAAERIKGCCSNSYAHIEPCPHTKQNNDADNLVTTYTQTDTEHTSHCRYCNYTATEAHTYASNGVCVCGKKLNASDLVSVSIFTSSDGTTYGDAKTESVVKANNFALPKPAAVDGLTFMGYLQTTTAPGSIEMKDSESNSLVHPGMTVAPTADITYHARYRYDYTDEWTWADDYSSATVTVTWPFNLGKIEKQEATVYSNSAEPTAEAAGYLSYSARCTYQKAEDIAYNFSDDIRIPYIYSLELKNASDNTATINNNIGNKVKTLTLSGRTLYKDGSWNTLCLPFDLTAEQVSSQLAPGSLKTLSSSSYANGTLTINFADATAIEAGKPYIIKWASGSDLVSPAFTDVTISGGSSSVKTDYITFLGTYSPVTLEANDKSVLYLGAGNKLYYPSANVTLNACRGVFALSGITAGDLPASTRSIVLNFGDDDATAIKTVSTPASPAADAWYALDGRRLSGKPAQKGIYITNGQKVVFK